jgi:hypothetical protein
MERSVVAVEMSPTYLKLVEIFPSENRVASVAVEPLDRARWGNDAYLEEQVKAAILQHKQAETVELVSCVAASDGMLRVVEIPDGEDNVPDALQWDMEQYLGRPLDEYLMDYQALGPNESKSGSLYLVAANRRDEVKRIQWVLRSTGFPLNTLDVDALAVLKAFSVNYPEMREQRTFLVKADNHSILCVRVQNGTFLGCDVLPVGKDIFNLDAQTRSGVFLDLGRHIRGCFDAIAWGKVDNVVICGDLAVNEKFMETLKAVLPVPLIGLDAFKEMAFIPGTEANAALMPAAAQCAGALGLALRRTGDSGINLLKPPRTIVLEPDGVTDLIEESGGRGRGWVMVALAMLLVAGGIYFIARYLQKKPVTKEEPSAIITGADSVFSVSNFPVSAETITDSAWDATFEVRTEQIFPGYSRLQPLWRIAFQHFSGAHMLRDLQNATPAGVGFTRIVITPPCEFYVYGVASTVADFQHFQSAIISLSGANLRESLTQSVGAGGTAREFRLSGQILYDTAGMTEPKSGAIAMNRLEAELRGFADTARTLGVEFEPPRLLDSSSENGMRRFLYRAEASCDYSQLQALLENLQRTQSNVGFQRVSLEARGNEKMSASLDLILYMQ